MIEKPKPELAGDEEFLRQHHIVEIPVGARHFYRVAKRDDESDIDKSVTAGEFFGNLFFFGADELLIDVGKAGFPSYPTRATMQELEEIAEQYVGTAPNARDRNNLPASFAWVLANFAEAEYYRQKFLAEKDLIEVWGIGVLMGRLVEWWAWRREGHDRNAVSGAAHRRNTSAARQAAVAENEPRIREILNEIARLHGNGLSLSRAFEIAANNGFGVSARANRSLYYRRRKKLLREARA